MSTIVCIGGEFGNLVWWKGVKYVKKVKNNWSEVRSHPSKPSSPGGFKLLDTTPHVVAEVVGDWGGATKSAFLTVSTDAGCPLVTTAAINTCSDECARNAFANSVHNVGQGAFHDLLTYLSSSLDHDLSSLECWTQMPFEETMGGDHGSTAHGR